MRDTERMARDDLTVEAPNYCAGLFGRASCFPPINRLTESRHRDELQKQDTKQTVHLSTSGNDDDVIEGRIILHPLCGIVQTIVNQRM